MIFKRRRTFMPAPCQDCGAHVPTPPNNKMYRCINGHEYDDVAAR